MSMKITPHEFARAPVIAEAMRIGALGRLVLHNAPALPAAPAWGNEPPDLEPHEKQMVIATAEGLGFRQMASRYFPGVNVDTLMDRHGRLQDGVDAYSRTHLVRRAAEWRGIPVPQVERLSQQQMAERLNPRQLLLFGMVSHGLRQPEITALTGHNAPLISSQLRRAREALLPEIAAPTTDQCLTYAFAAGVLALDDYLTKPYITEGLALLLDPQHPLRVPEGLLPDGPFPWPSSYSASIGRQQARRQPTPYT